MPSTRARTLATIRIARFYLRIESVHGGGAVRKENSRAIDFLRTEEHAKELSSLSLFHAIRDCQDTLDNADAFDRQVMGLLTHQTVVSEGGYYRDCISVYRTELKRRELR